MLVGTKANTIEEEEIRDLKAIVAPLLETFKLNEFMITDIGDKPGLKNIFRTPIRLVIDDESIIKFAEKSQLSFSSQKSTYSRLLIHLFFKYQSVGLLLAFFLFQGLF
ncbi:MAG: hypothetical protein ACFFCZ_11525 [Promethearchaeota archaeon]